jgi:hypothetical protein
VVKGALNVPKLPIPDTILQHDKNPPATIRRTLHQVKQQTKTAVFSLTILCVSCNHHGGGPKNLFSPLTGSCHNRA